jgi:hypothetical protein
VTVVHSSSHNLDGLTVADLVRCRLDCLTPAERKPVWVLPSNYLLIGPEPLAGFAQRAGVSHPSVLRFIVEPRFSGNAGFQAALRTELEAKLESPLAKSLEDGTEPFRNEDFLPRFANAACDDIRQSVASLPRSAFEGAGSLLADKANAIYLLGSRFTGLIATYTYMRLRVLSRNMHHMAGPLGVLAGVSAGHGPARGLGDVRRLPLPGRFRVPRPRGGEAWRAGAAHYRPVAPAHRRRSRARAPRQHRAVVELGIRRSDHLAGRRGDGGPQQPQNGTG